MKEVPALALVVDGEAPVCAKDPMMVAIEEKMWMVKLVMNACKSVAPISAAALLWKLASYLHGHHKHFIVHPTSRATTVLNLYMVVETLFAMYCARVRARGQALYDPPPTTTPAQRRQLFERCMRTVTEPRQYATAWLGDADLRDLRHGNVEDWLAWAFFNRSAARLSSEQHEEVHGFVESFAAATGHTLPPGHNGNVRAYKFNVEPVESAHRPLMYYLVAHGLFQRVMAPAAFAWLGFQGRRKCGSFNYWIRRARRASRAPIVLIHGIGVGPLPYATLVADILRGADESRDMVVLEVPAVAQQVAPPDLTPAAFVRDFADMFAREALPPALLAGHSYGTMCMAWVVKELPHLASSLAFLDPGCFLLHHAKTLKAIVYKKAENDAEELFQYFMRSELHFNNHVRRHFVWERNLLFFEDIPADTRSLVVLSEHDEIMPVTEIARVFAEGGQSSGSEGGSDGAATWPHIDLLHLDGAIHGGILLDAEQRAQVVEALLKL